MEIAGAICLAIFIATLGVLLLGKFNETAVVLFGMALSALVLILVAGKSFSLMMGLVGWDTIMFITAMMIIIAVVGSSGMFQYIALLLANRTAGDVRKIFVLFMALVYVISLVIHPLPTVLIMGTFTVEICKGLDADFRPFLMAECVIANFASIPTPIGSVPSMLIVFLAGLDIGLMFVVLFPLSLVLLGVTILYMMRYLKDVPVSSPTDHVDELLMVNPKVMIKSRSDFYVSLVALVILMIGMILAPADSAVVALLVAAGLLILSFSRAKDLLNRLSWDTIFFVVGLFGMVAAMEATGVITDIVAGMTIIVGSNIFIAAAILIWLPGLVLSAVDAIPVAALLAPVASGFGALNPVVPFSLVIGANLNGYVIPFGDAPNMVVVSLAEKENTPLTWWEFTKVVTPLGVLHLIISTVYIFGVGFLIP